MGRKVRCKHAFMGTVLVTDGDTILLDKGYGQADLEWNTANSPGVKFRSIGVDGSLKEGRVFGPARMFDLSSIQCALLEGISHG